MGSIEEVSRLLSQWEEVDSVRGDVAPILNKLAHVFELETQAFLKQDPDPFDSRDPSRSQPNCALGQILKAVIGHPRIVDEMVKVYCLRDVDELNTAVCRLLLDLLPGLEDVLFQEELFVSKLFHWAEFSPNPLQSYATGLLAAAMEISDIASKNKEKNSAFVPLMLKRLFELSKAYLQSTNSASGSHTILQDDAGNNIEKASTIVYSEESKTNGKACRKSFKKIKGSGKSFRYNPMQSEKKEKEKLSTSEISLIEGSIINEKSNYSWSENLLGLYQVFPLTLSTQQIYILQYLTPMGEYQELIGHVIEEKALALILRYVDLNQNPNVRLSFEALKYLASLLNHKKITLEFLSMGGLELLLKVPQSSIAAAGVSFCLYYLGYLEEALEKICTFSYELIRELTSYALWLLECSHDSSRCHAILFFGFAFRFKTLLQAFDEQDGLRKLFSAMSRLKLFVVGDSRPLSDDEIYGDRVTTKHVCATLKKYFEAHLALFVEVKRGRFYGSHNVGRSRTEIVMCEDVEKNIHFMHNFSLIPVITWKPVQEFSSLDGIAFLFALISVYLETGFSGRVETVKNALDVLKICALCYSGQMKFCDNVEVRGAYHHHITGFSILLQAAECRIPSADVQRSALNTIINCVCAELPNEESCLRSTPKKRYSRRKEVLNLVWKGVRIKNGIIVLINLLSIKVPITDADSIRALACRALCGLARSQNVQQIISKFPLVTDGQLSDLMKEPVLQDKCHDHLEFCKYGLELLERVSGSTISIGSGPLDLSKQSNFEVVTKTKIQYFEHQLLHLIGGYLSKKGFQQIAESLQTALEAKNTETKTQIINDLPSSSNGSVLKHTPWQRHIPVVSSKVKDYHSSAPIAHSISFIPPPSVPLKIKKKKPLNIYKHSRVSLLKPYSFSRGFMRSPALMKNHVSLAPRPTISLDSIVTEFLRKQHSLCKNPVLACPPFDLLEPHKCPEPQKKKNASVNCVLRLQKRQMAFENGGYGGTGLNTKFLYSRFRLLHTYHEYERGDINTCKFYNYKEDHNQKLILGTESGRIEIITEKDGTILLSKSYHRCGITHIDSRESTPLFITSDNGRIGTSCLWKYFEESDLTFELDCVKRFSDVSHLEFGKWSPDKLIATRISRASLIDANTFADIQNFSTEDPGNNYSKNRATLNFFDELVLSDGLLFDVRNGKMVHKLDKFNSIMNGVFHPNGREIISNSDIWDIRTFKLLRTVAGLDACRVTFNSLGNVIYAVAFKDSLTAGKMDCFYTFDAHDYSIISTVDVKKPVYEVSADKNDRFICTVEGLNNVENVCRIYEVGRTKQAGDENGNESEDSSAESGSSAESEVEEDDDSDDGDQPIDVQMEFTDDSDNDSDISVDWAETSSSDDDNEALFSLNT